MKELSIEEKAKAYDEAIKRAKDFMNGEAHYELKIGENIMCWIFPELRESEDERIRKEFCEDIWTYIPYEKAHKYIAWLEKQGEPKPAWSEEDEDTIKFLISHFCVPHCNRSFQFTSNKLITHDELLEKIRNLIPQNRWKPNDEQMEILSIYADQNNFDGSVLTSLYKDLKKLKEK